LAVGVGVGVVIVTVIVVVVSQAVHAPSVQKWEEGSFVQGEGAHFDFSIHSQVCSAGEYEIFFGRLRGGLVP
jgi:hypothetical protein